MWWTLFTFVLAVIITALIAWVIVKKVSVKWYEWLIGAIGLILLVFMLQNFFGTFSEGESHAAWTFLWTLGIPAVILIAVPFVLVSARKGTEA